MVSHVFEGAVSVGAFTQVSDRCKVPDEVLFGGELAEDYLSLGVVQASYGPGDLDLAPVLLISETLGEDPGELLDALHQAARRRLL